MQKNNINSNFYWNDRFAQNWETCQGPSQSRFFAKIAIEHIPRWLIEQIKRQSLTLVDWGCAQGDGTDVWASYIDACQIVGIDFSSLAIEQATQRYPSIRFINQDWIEAGVDQGENFDVLFSSNTLEHFHKPYDILNEICHRARKAIILALPYREFERIDEHFFSFHPENIPLLLDSGFKLIWSKVVDCRFLQDTFWPGEQIILVYANLDWLESFRLTLNDSSIEHLDQETVVTRLNISLAQKNVENAHLTQSIAERDAQNATLTQSIAERDAQNATLTQSIAERDAQNATLTQSIAERDAQNATLTQSIAERDAQNNSLKLSLVKHEKRIQAIFLTHSWKIILPLRRINTFSKSLVSTQKRYALLKSVYWLLPRHLRQLLNRQRHIYVANRINYKLDLNPNLDDTQSNVSEKCEWLKRANQAEHIAIITCGFEFDELVNQRPINEAKYFSDQGYFVLFVAWQWSPNETLQKGCSEVWPNVYQIPLFEFSYQAEKLLPRRRLSLFLITIPASILVNLIPFLRRLGVSIIYDIMDNWEAFFAIGQAPWFQKSVEDSLILQSDYVCAVSPSLRDKFTSLRLDISVIGNGYTPDVLGIEHKGIGGHHEGKNHIIGYFGHLTDAWFDWNQVFQLAKSRKDISFEIIGYGEPDWARKQSALISNIHLLGKIHPKELYRYTSRWSAGFIPFIEGILAEGVDPIKIYEYLYFGLPTMVTGIKHLKEYPMTYYAERKNILPALELTLQCTRKPEELNAFLERTTWRARFDTLLSEVDQKHTISCLYAS